MPLPSQSSRGGPSHASRMVSSRRARGGKRRLGGILVALLVVAGLWWVVFGGAGGDGGEGPEGTAKDLPTADSEPADTILASRDRPPSNTGSQPDHPTLRNGDPAPFHRTGADNTWSDEPTQTLASRDEGAKLPPVDRTENKQEPVKQPVRETNPPVTPPVTPVEEPKKADPTRLQEPPARVNSPTVRALVEEGAKAAQENRLVEARRLLNRALHDPSATEAERASLRDAIGRMNDTLVFSSTVVPGDPLAETYKIQERDNLSTLVRKHRLAVESGFIQRINRISDPTRIRVGQNIKFVRGPFHAVVDKDAFRLDLYADINDGAGNRMFIKSFPVGLGEHGSTPIGPFVVNSSKMENPSWVNPRTREKFAADDPMNPIGDRWLGLTGTGPETQTLSGYGIHGTIEPDSIGKEMSMGCIRCRSEDVEVIYEMLVPESSTVEIVP